MKWQGSRALQSGRGVHKAAMSNPRVMGDGIWEEVMWNSPLNCSDQLLCMVKLWAVGFPLCFSVCFNCSVLIFIIGIYVALSIKLIRILNVL